MHHLLVQLGNTLKGELQTDEFYRRLYATDASVYRELPLGVAFPKDVSDIQNIVSFASKHGISLIPRAAGTSLAGQCVGSGLVLDISRYMNRILELNIEESWVRVEPGVIRDELNAFLKPHGLHFGPNTSTSNRCQIGGMVGNNSCGSSSIVYGSTRDHVLELECILSDGSIHRFEQTDTWPMLADAQHGKLLSQIHSGMHQMLTDKNNQDIISSAFPDKTVSRRNTGYALDTLVQMQPFENEGKPFNLCSLLCGSEGTLAITSEIKLNLMPLPDPEVALVAAHFNSIKQSLEATVLAMNHGPTACELMDKKILDCTKDNLEQRKNRFFIQGDPEALLMIEFRAKYKQELELKTQALIHELEEHQLGFAFPVVHGTDTEMAWSLRKAGLGVLANIPGDPKAVACVEDTAVAVEVLPEYIQAFTELMADFDQEVVYYAHAGAGELHLRPILNLKDQSDRKKFREISLASAQLIKKFRGSLSGEHGDGRVRSEFIPLVLGVETYKLFQQLKQLWDPNGILNPGKIVEAVPMDSSLRYEPEQPTPDYETVLDFTETGGLLRAAEKCNGSGDCRKLNFAGGIMCPSYRATLDEKDSTRGRANILREFLTQNVKSNPFDYKEIQTAMDLCLGCKGCKSECPSNVDMASMKSEFLYQYAKTHGYALRTRMISKANSMNRYGRMAAGIYNAIVGSRLMKIVLGFATERSIPKLKAKSLSSWIKKLEQPEGQKEILFFCDEFTDSYDVEIGKKAILLLNALGVRVQLPDHVESGRASISNGMLKRAKRFADKNVEVLSALVSNDKPLIGIEPSAILSFRDEYPKLVDSSLRAKAQSLAEHVHLIDEYLNGLFIDQPDLIEKFSKEKRHIKLHAHCHQRVLSDLNHSKQILEFPEHFKVEVIEAGCCGMAGSFGYEKEHYELSQIIANQQLYPVIQAMEPDMLVAATGTSCRHQILDGTNKQSFHPVEILFDALDNE